LEYGSVDVPPVRADAAILTQLLARLVLDEAPSGPPRIIRLDATETDGGVAIECHSASDPRLTVEEGTDESLHEQGGEEMDMADPVLLAPDEMVRQMGGTLTKEGAADAELKFTIWLSTHSASDLMAVSAPIALWPPIAFELPRPQP
jgi:hypothetical protein